MCNQHHDESTSASSTTVSETIPATETPASSNDPSDPHSCDLGLWPDNISNSMREYWATKGSSDCSNSDADFSATSTLLEGDKYKRQCQKSMFTYTHQLTKEQHLRTWLCYSPSQHALYCFACKLMTDVFVFGKQGCTDWKHASQQISRHERSSNHRQAMVQLLQRSDANSRVDAELVKQTKTEREYWCSVLEQAVETICLLGERGLAFRGSDEVVGSAKNGNYLGVWELVAKFNPFLVQHIKLHANKGTGSHIVSV
ncbi:Hypothetical predicted protein [Paramuricea clavata]|uniref:Uncharacterized protein n=1 Tax=Paramuricea clavata TaxID=317549 RepID=A0A7D9DNW5_PARCT|nr:Hypothetical predicted protein [Paramuricea clavata]